MFTLVILSIGALSLDAARDLVILCAGTLTAALVTSIVPLDIARAVQGAGGGIFPLAFGIIRDEFPRERVAGATGSPGCSWP